MKLTVLVEQNYGQHDFTGYVPEMRLSATGDTQEEMMSNLKDLVELQISSVPSMYRCDVQTITFDKEVNHQTDLTLLGKQTCGLLVKEIELLMRQFNESIKNLNVVGTGNFVSVYFVLAEQGFVYTYDKRKGTYDESFMSLTEMQHFKNLGLLD
ncbi:hypothetical protein [Paenibacillus xylanexedens]|uniref:hypothetical protein n=1 Tax=Paenibacillus xylanexedens TaxID=528191 RepID=UPI00119D9D82|nr:hypothetical protein [Paenibacillus xylanexedens]